VETGYKRREFIDVDCSRREKRKGKEGRGKGREGERVLALDAF